MARCSGHGKEQALVICKVISIFSSTVALFLAKEDLSSSYPAPIIPQISYCNILYVGLPLEVVVEISVGTECSYMIINKCYLPTSIIWLPYFGNYSGCPLMSMLKLRCWCTRCTKPYTEIASHYMIFLQGLWDQIDWPFSWSLHGLRFNWWSQPWVGLLHCCPTLLQCPLQKGLPGSFTELLGSCKSKTLFIWADLSVWYNM